MIPIGRHYMLLPRVVFMLHVLFIWISYLDRGMNFTVRIF